MGGARQAGLAREKPGLGPKQWLRRLTPIELERLNGFPDEWTFGPSDSKRVFFRGNALVNGIIHRLGNFILA